MQTGEEEEEVDLRSRYGRVRALGMGEVMNRRGMMYE